MLTEGRQRSMHAETSHRSTYVRASPTRAVLAMLALVGSSVTAGGAAASRQAGDVVLEPSTLRMSKGERIPYELGTLYVPENRSDPKSRLIGVGFARFRASTQTGAPPTFHLPGGPGSSYLDHLTPDSEIPVRAANDVALYRGVSDVVFVDQRGFSPRGEKLRFKFKTAPDPLDLPGSLARSTARHADLARAAVADFAGRDIDLRGYTVLECAADVNDLRRALGYQQIILVGQSFGSQWSFAVMKLHPEIVKRAVLSGVEPLNHAYDMPSHVFAAIQRQWYEAEQDPRLKPWLPPGGLAAAARDVLRRLERAPLSVSLSGEQSATVVLGSEDFQRDFLSLAEPSQLLALYYGHYQSWARKVMEKRLEQEAEVGALIAPLIDTSLGVTPQREYQLRTDAGTQFLGHWNFDASLATAGIWPTEDVGDSFRGETINSLPILFIHGDWDTSTPIENLMRVTPYFTQSRVLVVEHGGHNAFARVRAELPDTAGIVMEFLRTGATSRLPVQVALPKPSPTLPDFPPTADRVGS